MEQEIWKDIPLYEGYYQASNIGNIRSLDRFDYGGRNRLKGIIIKPRNAKDGYRLVSITKNGVRKSYLVHRLVSSAFYGLSLDNPIVIACHKNDIRSDNRAENLFIGTHKDNMADMVEKGRSFSRKIHQYSKDGIYMQTFVKVEEARIHVGAKSNWNIVNCAKGKVSTAYGFKWKYSIT